MNIQNKIIQRERTMMECKEILLSWLKKAYAMEKNVEKVLEAHLKDAENMPEIQSDLQEHIDETKMQAEKVKAEIERLGGDISAIGEEMAEFMGWATGAASDLAKDKIVKNAIAEHATEHLEMATYMSIAEAAKICGESKTEKMAHEIMEQETEGAKKMEQNIKMVVAQYMREQAEEM